MTIWEAIQDAKERKRKAEHVSNVPAWAITGGTSLGTGATGFGLTKGLFNNGVQIPMNKVQDLARMAGLDVRAEARPGFAENAYYRPNILSKLTKQPIGGQHGSIGRVGVMPDWIPADFAAHEIGHGLSWSGKAGVLPKLIAHARIPGQLGASLGSLIGLLKGTTGQRSLEEREKWLNRASIAGGVGMAPVLADEVIASRNAIKFLRSLPATVFEKEMAQKAVPRLGRAFGSYGLAGLGLVLGPQIAKRYYQKQYER